jgi:hypothetical protein
MAAAWAAAMERPVGHPCSTAGNPAGGSAPGFMPGAELYYS